MKLSDASNRRNRPVGYCYSLGQHMLAGCCASDIGRCVEEGGTGGRKTAVEDLVGVVTQSHVRLEKTLCVTSLTADKGFAPGFDHELIIIEKNSTPDCC